MNIEESMARAVHVIRLCMADEVPLNSGLRTWMAMQQDETELLTAGLSREVAQDASG